MIEVREGDCVDVLAAMPEHSIDAVVCDPPYGLEFMGKEWDRLDGSVLDDPAEVGGFQDGAGGNPYSRSRIRYGRTTGGGTVAEVNDTEWDGREDSFPFGGGGQRVRYGSGGAEMQAWHERWLTEALRVLKPGGWLLAFSGTRTYHRLACAAEDAGFEVRDMIDWLYGCLTADVEVLTEHGWKPGIEVEVGDPIAQWDPTTGTVSLAPVAETFRGPWDGPMRVLRNADTDQVLTPNHRVWHQPRQRAQRDGVRTGWYDDAWQVAEAETLTTWNPVRLPLGGDHDGPGIGGADYAALLGWVWTEGGFDHSGTGVRVYQSSVNPGNVAEIDADVTACGRHKRYDRDREYRGRRYTETCWFISGALARDIRADLPGKRPTYALLWRMTLREKRAFLRAAMLGDGTGWGTTSEQFFQRHEDDLVWFQTLLALVGRAGKVGMRPDRDNGQVYLRRNATTELQARHLADSAEHYTGEVWCVRVPTGAFLARRAGRVFVTGNSGFPKSMDVAKAIDAHLGVDGSFGGPKSDAHAGWIERGSMRAPADTTEGHEGWRHPWEDDPDAVDRNAREYLPGSEEAARWAGWGTALKPGHEPLVVARKPFTGADILAAIGSHLDRLEDECASLARPAGPSSSPTRAAAPEARAGSAPERAATRPADDPASGTPIGVEGGSPEATATSASESMAATCWNIVTSWRNAWAALSAPTSTFTTSTDDATTTDLRTLLSCLSRITAANMLADLTPTDGPPSPAEAVGQLFAAVVLRWNATLALSADESATGTMPPNSPGGDAGSPRPGHEPILVARKPIERSVAANVLAYGTGALNIDASRIAVPDREQYEANFVPWQTFERPPEGIMATHSPTGMNRPGRLGESTPGGSGRWPANVILTHAAGCAQVGWRDVPTGTVVSRNLPDEGAKTGPVKISPPTQRGPDHSYGVDGRELIPEYECVPGCPVAELDAQSGETTSPSGAITQRGNRALGFGMGRGVALGHGDTGGASRFFKTADYVEADRWIPDPASIAAASTPTGSGPGAVASFEGEPPFRYVAKTSTRERNLGLAGFPEVFSPTMGNGIGEREHDPADPRAYARNHHPTVKPVELMRYLVRLVTPPGGTVLDPFLGSGTTAIACVLDGFSCVGIEREPEYVTIARARIEHARQSPRSWEADAAPAPKVRTKGEGWQQESML